jgi:hypothetical protein
MNATSRDDICDRCGERLDACTCDARRKLDQALSEALGRGVREPPCPPARELRERASVLVRHVQEAIRQHVEESSNCPHCARCPQLFHDLLAAERAAIDLASNLDLLERLTRRTETLASLCVDTNVLAAALRRCHSATENMVARISAVVGLGPLHIARSKREPRL